MSWDLLGGDPAPGSVAGIQAIAATFGRVVDQVSAVHTTLTQAGTDGANLDWQGQGRAAFDDLVAHVPPPLQAAITSFQQAQQALTRYAGTLEDAQASARRLLTTATQAEADRANAASRLNTAHHTLDEATAKATHTATTRRQAQAAEAANVDPTQSAALINAATIARAHERQAQASKDLARADVERATSQLQDAQRRLQAARRSADELRDQVHAAARRAIDALHDAQKAGDLPGMGERLLTDTRDYLQVNGPALAEMCRDVASAASTVGFILSAVGAPELGAPLLLGATVLSAGALLLDVATAASQDDGFTTRAWAIIAGDALTTAGTAAGLGTASRVWSTVSKVGLEAGSVSTGYSKDGTTGAFLAVGALGVGAVVSRTGVPLIQKGVRAMESKSPALADAIDHLSGTVRRGLLTDVPGTTGLHLPAPDAGEQILQLGQSILTPGAGQFLPGFTDAATATSHALTGDVIRTDLEPATSWMIDKLKDMAFPVGDERSGL